MKTTNFLKTIAVVVALATISMSSIAQVTGTGTLIAKTAGAPDNVDYVTVGSVVPYKVTPYNWLGLAASMNASSFQWAMTTGVSGTDWTLYKADGTTALPFVGPNSTESDITIKWLLEGSYTINVAEKSNPKVGTGCVGNVENLPINVIPHPKAMWAAFTDPSGCGLTGPINVPVTCAGSSTITVSYSVVYTPAATGVAGAPSALTATVAAGGYNQTGKALNLPVTLSGDGKYDVTITGVVDPISEKSFGLLAASNALRNGASGTDYSATTVTFYSYPTPVTNPIQHLQN